MSVTLVCEGRPLRTASGALDIQGIAAAHAAAVSRIRRYRQVLWNPVPFGTPVLVDAAIDVDAHVHHVALPAPGGTPELQRLIATLLTQPLDVSRPLWESWVIEGLEGDRVALLHKVHHCLVDGLGGLAVLQEITKPWPHALPHRSAASKTGDLRPALPRLVSAAAFQGLAGARDALRDLISAGGAVRAGAGAGLVARLAAVRAIFGAALVPAPATPLNAPVGPSRRIASLSSDLEQIREVARRNDAKCNDVVLAIAAGAFRDWLRSRRVRLRGLGFRVLVPVSLRTAAMAKTTGNHVGGWIVELPLEEKDPKARLARIAARTRDLRQGRQVAGNTLIGQATSWAAMGLAVTAGHLPILPFNSLVTNIPGPTEPLYLGGARLLELHPHAPLIDRMAFAIALLSYAGRLQWGLCADASVMPDPEEFADLLASAAAEYGVASDDRRASVDAVVTDRPLDSSSRPGNRVATSRSGPRAIEV